MVLVYQTAAMTQPEIQAPMNLLKVYYVLVKTLDNIIRLTPRRECASSGCQGWAEAATPARSGPVHINIMVHTAAMLALL